MHTLLRNYLINSLMLNEEQITLILSKFRMSHTRRNEILLKEGDICRNMYFVNKGCLRIYLMDDEFKASTRFLIFEGQFGTAFPSFILQQPSLANVQSIEPAELLAISYTDFQELIQMLPAWERIYRLNLERSYIAAIERIESLIAMDAKERYKILMREQPKMIHRLPAKVVADYLGISQETLSRLKAKK